MVGSFEDLEKEREESEQDLEMFKGCAEEEIEKEFDQRQMYDEKMSVYDDMSEENHLSNNPDDVVKLDSNLELINVIQK
jgi:hypothetical protein